MGIEHRRFPRFHYAGIGQVRTTGNATREIPIAIQTVSPRGIGVKLQSDENLCPGRPIELSFSLDGQALNCNAHVVWAAGGYAGISLRTKSLSQEGKRAFAEWLKPRIRHQREEGMRI